MSQRALFEGLVIYDPKTMGPSGGPITHDMNAPEVYAVVFALGPGKRNVNVLWSGSDDGVVHLECESHFLRVTRPFLRGTLDVGEQEGHQARGFRYRRGLGVVLGRDPPLDGAERGRGLAAVLGD